MLEIRYSADAVQIGHVIVDLPDTVLQQLLDMVWLLPELFPKLTIQMVKAEARKRGWGCHKCL